MELSMQQSSKPNVFGGGSEGGEDDMKRAMALSMQQSSKPIYEDDDEDEDLKRALALSATGDVVIDLCDSDDDDASPPAKRLKH
ncbi:hypothetical protein TL16_g12400 [Triparma laevis f. inornata]|uniref:Uncharacterized protein n=2 Tax=Triparma laevis TaxID=1534972 RepID=A0A9W7FD37_9STRA|nr:hypothetical protein TL16_g12400 [Triparma laevis f. inornata]GMI09984.1 hypothetical protein TrLO_g15330 [Triparma laevis f. longispina]